MSAIEIIEELPKLTRSERRKIQQRLFELETHRQELEFAAAAADLAFQQLDELEKQNERPLRGEIWVVDLGMAAKVRPCLLLTNEPTEDELALVTVMSHTTSVSGNSWELVIPKPFLRPGAFHLQQINSVPVAKLSHRIGVLSSSELALVEEGLRRRLQL